MLDKAKTSLPWQNDDPLFELQSSIFSLVDTLKDIHANKKSAQINGKDQIRLTSEFKKAKLGRSKSHRFIAAITKAIGIKKPETRIQYAEGKEWERAKEKLSQTDRNLNDLERARVLLSSVDRYNSLIKLLKGMSKDGKIRGISIEGVSILPDKIDNYLEEARSSGWAGALNMDLEVDLGKGRKGKFEIQFMPEAYERIEPLSHRLYDMIRILDPIPEAFNPDAHKIKEALILANHALYIEEAYRTGFIEVRKDNVPKFTPEKVRYAYDVLDRIGNEIDNLGGRSLKWKKETHSALTEAKTSLQNVSLAAEKGAKLIPNSP